VSVESIDEDRIVRRDRIDPLVTRQRRPRPQRVIPIAAENPFARLEMRGVRFQASHELLWCRGVAQIHRRELKAPADEMRVAIDESRHDEPAVGTQDLRGGADVAGHLCRLADGEDFAGGNRDRPGLAAPRRETSPDRTTLDDDVRCGTAGGKQGQRDYAPRTTHDAPTSGAW